MQGTIEIVSTYPAEAAPFDQNAGTIDICFSTLLAPDSVNSRPVQLVSGKISHELDVELQLFSWRRWLDADQSYDPAAYGIRDCPGSVLSIRPREALVAGLRYRLIVDDSPKGWNGETLNIWADGWQQTGRLPTEENPTASGRLEFDGLYTLSFVASAASTNQGEDDDPESRLTLAELFAPGEVFAVDQGNCSCHQAGSGLATELLNLGSPALATLSLRDRLTSNGWPMVSAGNPAASYLIQKLVADPNGGTLRTVLGEPMPLQHQLDPRQRARIVQWVAEGARFE